MLRTRPANPDRSRSPSYALRRNRAKNLFWAAIFFALGVIGIALPIMPQVPFFIMSLLFLSLVFPSVRRALRRFLHRHPKAAHAYKKWKDRRRKKRLTRIRKSKDRSTKMEG